MAFKLESSAFQHETPIPTKHTGEGMDRSPPLGWSEAPRGTRAFALICDDPDAPVGLWVHWVLYDIPAQARSLPEGVAATARTLENGAKQGKNSWGVLGYRGPMPPEGHGRHRYYFQLFALSQRTGLDPGASRDELLEAIRDKVLAKAQLLGTYQR